MNWITATVNNCIEGLPGPKIKAMSNNLTQTKLELFYRMQVQKTIPEYVSIRKMKVHDRCIRIVSTRDRCGTIVCPHVKRSHVSRSFSYIRCNYQDNSKKQSPGPCYICPMKKIKGTWVPVRTECRPVFISFRQMRKFWNWQKE